MLKIDNCLDCANHEVIKDPDPSDWFCDDDKAVVCNKMPDPDHNPQSKFIADHHHNRKVTCACRPYNLRKESSVPGWCPLRATMPEQFASPQEVA